MNKKINIPMRVEVQNFEEFEEWVGISPNKKFPFNKLNVSKIVVNSILDNLYETNIPIFEVLVKDQGTIYDISVNEKDFVFTLEKNLQILEDFEEYELCDKVVKTLNQLKLNK
jgi:hypothetical protein